VQPSAQQTLSIPFRNANRTSTTEANSLRTERLYAVLRHHPVIVALEIVQVAKQRGGRAAVLE
jgi:hypothetical protein